MALARAACLRPFVSLRDFGGVASRSQARRPPSRPLACAAPAPGASAAASPPPPPPPAAASDSPAAAAPAAPKYDTLSAAQQAQVDAYLDILLEWNQNMNLTAITDRAACYERHVNDSLALLPALDRCLAEQAAAGGGGAPSAPPRLIDVGSGAGLPGIMLAIARPEWEVTLLDSLQKRCKFNEAAVAAAGLGNVRVHWARAEDAGQAPALRQQFDAAIARAVAELRVLAELCLPLVRPGGHWVAAKGAAPAEEVKAAGKAISKLGGQLVGVEEVDSEAPEGRRTAVVVLKARPTPKEFPRRPGTPSKKPL